MTNLDDISFHGRNGQPYKELAYLIAMVYNIVNHKLEVLLRKHGISLPKFNILMILKRHGGEQGMSQKAISDGLIISDGNITGILDRMEKENLLMRVQHPKDRRVNLVRITPKGSQLLVEVMPKYEKILETDVGKITSVQQKTIMPIFYKWAKQLT